MEDSLVVDGKDLEEKCSAINAGRKAIREIVENYIGESPLAEAVAISEGNANYLKKFLGTDYRFGCI